jgi:hypothetical protein
MKLKDFEIRKHFFRIPKSRKIKGSSVAGNLFKNSSYYFGGSFEQDTSSIVLCWDGCSDKNNKYERTLRGELPCYSKNQQYK